jgi:hypothetical protein
MADIPVNTTTKTIDWRTLVYTTQKPEPTRDAYEFSNGRKFKEDDKSGVYDAE